MNTQLASQRTVQQLGIFSQTQTCKSAFPQPGVGCSAQQLPLPLSGGGVSAALPAPPIPLAPALAIVFADDAPAPAAPAPAIAEEPAMPTAPAPAAPAGMPVPAAGDDIAAEPLLPAAPGLGVVGATAPAELGPAWLARVPAAGVVATAPDGTVSAAPPHAAQASTDTTDRDAMNRCMFAAYRVMPRPPRG